MPTWITALKKSLQIRILASVLLGLGVMLVGLAALVFKITEESTRYALAERLVLAQTIRQAIDREIEAAVRFGERLANEPDIRTDHDLGRFLGLTGMLEAAALVREDGTVVVAAGRRHDPRQAWPRFVLRESSQARAFQISGPLPGIGIAVPIAPNRLLLASINRDRLLSLLQSHPSESEYSAQLIGPEGFQFAVTALPVDAIRRHLALVEPLSRRAEAGVVLHSIPDHRLDHYIAYAPMTTLPGFGVTVEQPRDVVVALPIRLRRLILGFGLLMLLIGGAVAWLDVRRVVTPLRILTGEAERIGSGDLATPIRLRRADEIGVLAASLDGMRRHLADSLAEIERRETRTRALHEVATGILRIPDRDEALDLVVSEAHRLLGVDVTLLCVYDPQGQRLQLGAAAGDRDGIVASESSAGPPPDLGGCAILSKHYRVGHLIAPVRAGDMLLGSLCAGSRTARDFTNEDRALLESLGTLAALALENLHLRAEVQSLSTIKERERLARELHDGLAQSLGMVYAHARSGTDETTTRRSLDRIVEVIARAYDEVRQAIFGLRLAHGTNMLAALGEYLREFARQTGLQADLVIEQDRATALALETEVQVVRIVQEALANVRRHALATRAVVKFAVEGDDAVVSIEDDGVGFAPDSIGDRQRHFGLSTMRERAESVGGTLTVASAPRQGTRVMARLPLGRVEAASWTRSG